MTIQIGKRANSAFVNVNNTTKRTKFVDNTVLSVTGTNGFSVSSVTAYAHSDSTGKWRLVGNLFGTKTNNTTGTVVTFTGVVFDASDNQSIVAYGGNNLENNYAVKNTATINIAGPSTSTPSVLFSFDVSLNSEPTWAAANLENLADFSVYAPPASASEYGLVKGGQLPGDVSGSAIASGYVGEIITGSGSNVSTNTSTDTSIASVTLTAGTWLLTAQSMSDNTATQTGADHRLYIKGITTNTVGKDLANMTTVASGGTSVTFCQVVTVAEADGNKGMQISQQSRTSGGKGYGYITATRIA